jgi:hypothetical protein
MRKLAAESRADDRDAEGKKGERQDEKNPTQEKSAPQGTAAHDLHERKDTGENYWHKGHNYLSHRLHRIILISERRVV